MDYEDLKRIAVLYTEAENAVKRYERITDDNLGFVLESLNEATRLVLSACQDNIGEGQASQMIIAAEASCGLALGDARRGVIAAMIDEIDSFWKSDPPEWFLNENMPEWGAFFDDCDTIRKRWHDDVSFGVKKETWKQAENDYGRLQEIRRRVAVVAPGLYEIRFKAVESKWRCDFKSAKDERRRLQSEEQANECRDDTVFVLSVILALAGMVPAAISVGIAKGWVYDLCFLACSFVVALVFTGFVFGLLRLCRLMRQFCVRLK